MFVCMTGDTLEFRMLCLTRLQGLLYGGMAAAAVAVADIRAVR